MDRASVDQSWPVSFATIIVIGIALVIVIVIVIASTETSARQPLLSLHFLLLAAWYMFEEDAFQSQGL